MTRIHSATRYDTPEIAALRNKINVEGRAIDEQLRKHRRRELEHFAQYVELLLARRPAYPTDEHLQALRQIAQLVHENLPYGDHLGYPRPEDRAVGLELPSSVQFCSQVNRINVYAHAPYAPGSIRRIWEFTTGEVTALRQQLHGLSLSVVSEWEHDDGVGFIVAISRRV